jgi:hypothetical protein
VGRAGGVVLAAGGDWSAGRHATSWRRLSRRPCDREHIQQLERMLYFKRNKHADRPVTKHPLISSYGTIPGISDPKLALIDPNDLYDILCCRLGVEA